jgi:hypothetical protein
MWSMLSKCLVYLFEFNKREEIKEKWVLVKQGLPSNTILCFQCITTIFITASFKMVRELCTTLQSSLTRSPADTIKK